MKESHREEVLKFIQRRRFKDDIKRYTAVLSISLLMHAMILFFISMIPPEDPFEDVDVVVIETAYEAPELVIEEVPRVDVRVDEVLENIEATKIELSEPKIEEKPLEEIVEVEPPAVAEPEPTKDLDELMNLVDEGLNNANDLGTMAMLGLKADSGPGGGIPEAYKGRSSQKQKSKLSTMFGGGERTLDAMEKALAWLAAHQNLDGSWYFMPMENVVAAKKVEPKADNEDKAVVVDAKVQYINSITASALLAFLGAGYSETSGKYKKNVSQGIKYLNRSVKAKKDKPHFDSNYGTALVLMALSEATIFGSSPTTKVNADAIASYLFKMYQGENGWGYSGAGIDFSVSGWVALALKSAKQADLPSLTEELMKKFYVSYGKWVTERTNPENGLGSYRGEDKWSHSMAYVGMFQKQFLGFPKNDPFLVKASAVGTLEIPKLFVENGDLDEYSIYYGTLAAFQQQGVFWQSWNAAMKKILVTRQKSGEPEKLGGSWDPSSRHVGERGGRVMSTALFCLCLEVYFRYSLIK